MTVTLREAITRIAKKARQAQYEAATLPTKRKNRILKSMASLLRAKQAEIRTHNTKDLKTAKRQGLSQALMDRLTLTGKRIEEIAKGLEGILALPDPVGQTVKSWTRPNGLKIARVRISLGVIAMIYESRPNVTVDAAALCFKSGNAVILRGGSEALHSNLYLGSLFRKVLKKEGISQDMIQVIPVTDRDSIPILAGLTGLVDLIIPRGGPELMKKIDECARVPVLKHDRGTCHVYVDAAADLTMAEEIAFNSKVQRPGVCNAMETLLVHEKVAQKFLPKMIARFQKAGVEIRGDAKTKKIVPKIKNAQESDWPAEYLDLILAVKIVRSLDDAMVHIRKYGSSHTESIVTENRAAAETFLRGLDSSAVMVNASTRLNDGAEFGLGAEIGISTTKLHAFGPMGLEELTTTKFVVRGKGQIRES